MEMAGAQREAAGIPAASLCAFDGYLPKIDLYRRLFD